MLHALKNKKGSGLVEVIIVASIISVVSFVFIGSFITLSSFHERNTLHIKAHLLAEEGIEIVRLIKHGNWENIENLPVNQPYYLSFEPFTWNSTSTPEIIDGIFYRHFILRETQRDVLGTIVSSGGVVDSNTRLVESFVSWVWDEATTTASYKAYVTSF